MPNPIGPVIAADESFTHQIPETFAHVASSDPSWTEKVCAMAMARDGSLQLGFGLGKYTNRNVMDAYAALSRGVEQVTVRASRRRLSAVSGTGFLSRCLSSDSSLLGSSGSTSLSSRVRL